MNQHARMFKTLGCLAGAMTSTAAFLHWIDPSSPLRTQTLTAREVAALAHALVTEAVEIKSDQWKDVEIVAGPTAIVAGTPLTASPDPLACHFYVDQAGRPSRARGWSHQTPPYDAPHTVRIQVARTAGAVEFPTLVQWFTVRSLVSALDGALSANGDMPVYVHDGPAEAGAVFLAADLRPVGR